MTVVVVGCGAAKLDSPAPAASLYTGRYFRACMMTAQAITSPDRIFILSARYGLVPLDERLEPYDLTIGQDGAADAARIAADAARLGLSAAPRVVVLASARYAALCRAVWPHAETPLTGQGIGRQRHTLSVIRQQGLPGRNPAA